MTGFGGAIGVVAVAAVVLVLGTYFLRVAARTGLAGRTRRVRLARWFEAEFDPPPR